MVRPRFFLPAAAVWMAILRPLFAQDPMNNLKSALDALHLKPQDLTIRSDRWDTRFTLPAIENLLKNPIDIPSFSVSIASRAAAAQQSSDGVRLSADLLNLPQLQLSETASQHENWIPKNVPASIVAPLQRCLNAIREAQPLLNRAVHSVPADQRELMIQTWMHVMTNRETTDELEQVGEGSRKFDLHSLFSSALKVTQAVDNALPMLETASKTLTRPHRWRWSSPAGDVLVATGAEQTFNEKDIQGVVLLINLSQRSHYHGRVAGAGEGEIRVVIDVAKNVTVQCEDSPGCAGAGIFGVGLFYLPGEGGTKEFHTGDLSLGAGLFGVGGVWANDSHGVFESRSAAQGAAAFGLGFLSVSDPAAAHYNAWFGAQGVGFTQGTGIFFHRGDDAVIEGGLHFADPREPLAITSVCQGVGYGPRAFAAGGIGVAAIRGDRNHLSSSYIAQGSGYWHSLGIFDVDGAANHIQARRYDQGTGVHTAVGAMTLRGDDNQVINWGVGPAYGWDYGIGSLALYGNKNILQAEWATGHGEVNGHALAQIQGNFNRLYLPGFGSGYFSRNAGSYGVAAVTGQENRLKYRSRAGLYASPLNLAWNPWGLLRTEGSTVLDPALSTAPVTWPTVDRAGEQTREHQELASRLADADRKTAALRIADWISIASNFGLDEEIPKQALEKLYRLNSSEISEAVDRISSDRFDEFITLRTTLAGYGAQLVSPLTAAMATAKGSDKSILLSLYAACRLTDGFPIVAAATKDPDWRIRRTAALVLGSWLDPQQGHSPGRVFLLNTLEWGLRRTSSSAIVPFAQTLQKSFGDKTLAEILPLLALDPDFSANDRWAFVSKNPDPYAPLNRESAKEMARILLAKKPLYKKVIADEHRKVEDLKSKVRAALLPLLQDADPDVLQAALIALGQLGDKKDVPYFVALLNHRSAMTREGAATALSKLGRVALPNLRKTMRAPSSLTRIGAIHAAMESWDPALGKILLLGLRDPQEEVRFAALSALAGLPPDLKIPKQTLQRELNRIQRNDPVLSLRLTAGFVLEELQ